MPTAWSASASPRAPEVGAAARYEPRDAFYERAQREGYRSRAAYKLLDLLERIRSVRPGSAVVELGCWPGAWLQILAERVGPDGRVVGVDLEEVDPLDEHVELIRGDFTEPEVVDEIEARLGRKADAVLSDAAPKLTGIKDVDRAAVEELHDAALVVADRVLGPKGVLVVKTFPGPEASAFRRRLGKRFDRVEEVKPEGRRATSKESYLVATPAPKKRRRRRSRS